VSFSPAVSGEAGKRIGREIRRWRLHRLSDKTVTDLARSINVIRPRVDQLLRAILPLRVVRLLRRINEYLIRWAMRKYKRLRRRPARARRFLADVARREPGLFAHWRFGVRPDGWAMGAG
jgi:RNA-directed DNA polymerase